LLDWSRSAFVGAYFGYRKFRNSNAVDTPPEQKIRIFVFDRERWFGDVIQMPKLAPAQPHVSLLDALAIENARMIPQRALFTVTNADDVESYIQFVEQHRQKSYLRAIELPVRECSDVMNDLRQMGITAGSMLLGLDGACEALREQYFPLAYPNARRSGCFLPKNITGGEAKASIKAPTSNCATGSSAIG
jgi:hypothetical protein